MGTPLKRAYDEMRTLKIDAAHHSTRSWAMNDELCTMVGCKNNQLMNDTFGRCRLCFENACKHVKWTIEFYTEARERDELCPGIVARYNDKFFYFSKECGEFKSKKDNRRCAECGSEFGRCMRKKIEWQEKQKKLQRRSRKKTNSPSTL